MVDSGSGPDFSCYDNDPSLLHQYYISKGGTDAAKALDMHDGIIATTIGLPSRYIHSPAAVFDTRDLEACHQMTLTLLNNLNQDTIIKPLEKSPCFLINEFIMTWPVN